uniref:Uncharacterized protein n=1 Tax=Oryza brachyantha TaxID=4533 RepID=J3MTJ0_ORYBR
MRRLEQCGEAGDVWASHGCAREDVVNSVRRPSEGMPAGPTPLGHAARMFRPGAIRS